MPRRVVGKKEVESNVSRQHYDELWKFVRSKSVCRGINIIIIIRAKLLLLLLQKNMQPSIHLECILLLSQYICHFTVCRSQYSYNGKHLPSVRGTT